MAHRIDGNAKSGGLPSGYDTVLVSGKSAEIRRNLKGHASSMVSIPLSTPRA
jgi:hypothetical protein